MNEKPYGAVSEKPAVRSWLRDPATHLGYPVAILLVTQSSPSS